LKPVHLAFLGCGFITRVHSRHLRKLRDDFVCSYASRDGARAAEYRRRFKGVGHYGSYDEVIDDPSVDAVVIAVPTRFHLELSLRALEAGKHVLVEKPAFPRLEDYQAVIEARDRAGRVVIIGENDHYKPLCVVLRRLLSDGAIGEMVFGHFVTIMKKPKTAEDWRNDEEMAGGDAFFEEGIHWLHIAGSLGPRIVRIHGYRPPLSQHGPLDGDARRKSMLVAFQYDNGAAGALYYSREVPSLLRGLRLSKLFGREGIITFESNGAFLLARGKGFPRCIFPGFRDIRGYRAMYRDFAGAIRDGHEPQMGLERAREDHLLMDAVYASVESTESVGS
jgi:predicted dehydrogenase